MYNEACSYGTSGKHHADRVQEAPEFYAFMSTMGGGCRTRAPTYTHTKHTLRFYGSSTSIQKHGYPPNLGHTFIIQTGV